MNVLQINSSARREASHSTRLATRLVQRLRDADPKATLTVRDLSNAPHRSSTKPRSARSSPRPTSGRRNRRRAWRWTTP